MTSIRRKLLLTLLGALLAAGFTTAAATFFSAQAEFNEFLDTHLKETAESLGESVRNSAFPINPSPHMTIVGDAESYQIVIQSTTRPPTASGTARARPRCRFPKDRGSASNRWTANPGAPTRWRRVRSSSPSVRTRPYARILPPRRLPRSATALPAAAFIAIAVWIVVGEGLAPLERTARSVARRSPTSLTPISTKGLPSELLGLVSAINQLLERLEQSLSAQQRFASDAAHELRTPLTALKLQVQLAQRAKTPEAREKCFVRLNEGINRATRLVQQLLTLARLDPTLPRSP